MNKAVDAPARFLEIEGIANFRDIGGYTGLNGQTVRWGKVYRAGQLNKPSASGVDSLKALNIATVVDLRFSEETQRYPTYLQALPGAQVLQWQTFHKTGDSNSEAKSDKKLSWKDALETGDPQAVRTAMRDNYPDKLYSHQGIYKAMILSLIEGDTPLVFHCAAGKDRTGVGAAIILGLLGVSNEDIIEDYLLTQKEIGKLYEQFRAGGATTHQEHSDFQKRLASYPPSLVAPVFEADPDYIHTLLDYVAKKYLSFDAYAEQVLGFGGQDIRQLQSQLLQS